MKEEKGQGKEKESRKCAMPVSFAKPHKMFSSHKISLVSANYL